MADMVGYAGAALAPLAEALHRMLLTSDVLHEDETPLQILDTKKGGKSSPGYLWAYVSGEWSDVSVVCFDSQPGRGHEYPENWLHGWKGKLVVDGHKAYRTLANKVVGITLAGCWVHARRGFADLYKVNKDPRAAMAMRKIAGLYRLEKKVSHRPADKILQWRKRYVKPMLDDLWAWLTEQETACPPGGAIVYALSHRVELSVFLDDGAVSLDNNVCERAIKTVVMGRKSWLFTGSRDGGSPCGTNNESAGNGKAKRAGVACVADGYSAAITWLAGGAAKRTVAVARVHLRKLTTGAATGAISCHRAQGLLTKVLRS